VLPIRVPKGMLFLRSLIIVIHQSKCTAALGADVSKVTVRFYTFMFTLEDNMTSKGLKFHGVVLCVASTTSLQRNLSRSKAFPPHPASPYFPSPSYHSFCPCFSPLPPSPHLCIRILSDPPRHGPALCVCVYARFSVFGTTLSHPCTLDIWGA